MTKWSTLNGWRRSERTCGRFARVNFSSKMSLHFMASFQTGHHRPPPKSPRAWSHWSRRARPGRVHAHLAQSAVPEAFRPSARLRPPFSRMRPMSSSTRRGSSWRPLRCAPPRVTRTCRHGRGGRIRRTFGPKAPRAKTGGGRVHLGSRLRWATNDSGASVWSVCPGVFLYSSFVSREAAPQLQVRLNGFQRDVVTLL